MTPALHIERIELLSRRHPVQIIQRAVAENYDINFTAIIGQCQNRAISRSRHIAMYLCSELLQVPASQIARRFDRDHSTVLESLRKIKKMRRCDPKFEFELQVLMEQVRETLRKPGAIWQRPPTTPAK